MSEIIGVLIHGGKEARGAIDAAQARVDKATIAAIRANQRIIKAAVRKNLTGAPRWNYRGKSRIYDQPVKVDGAPRHSPRGGPPGLMTGALRKGVGGVRRPTGRPNGDLVGGVGVGGKTNNFKKRVFEAKFPYFRPAVEAVEPRLGPTYNRAWGKAVERMGGL